MSQERHGAATFQGNPLTLVGPELKPGDKAPDFTLVSNDLTPVGLNNSAGKVRLISVVPSLDTPICDEQTRRFNQEASDLGDGVVVLTMPRNDGVEQLELIEFRPYQIIKMLLLVLVMEHLSKNFA